MKKDIQENLKEISFFEDPVQHEKNRQAAKMQEIKTSIRRFNQHPKKGLKQLIEKKQTENNAQVTVDYIFVFQIFTRSHYHVLFCNNL